MKLTATVMNATGASAHYEGALEGEIVVKSRPLPSAETLEIQDAEQGFYLLRFDAEGEFAGDTWHLTLEEAKAQAAFEFEINDVGWRVIDE